ncbi:MAG: hypothetical protein D6694_14330 [Gammaproteobacteria bacterium]|nr:MAG: hypothetical protein D6694_14330 [Gammaproteobacteria bacterium]
MQTRWRQGKQMRRTCSLNSVKETDCKYQKPWLLVLERLEPAPEGLFVRQGELNYEDSIAGCPISRVWPRLPTVMSKMF